MISCPCGRNVIGNKLLYTSCFSNSFAAIRGVKLEVAHVSRTSFSGSNALLPQLHAFNGLSTNGSTGNCFSSANTTLPHFLQYHNGNGTPKKRCREMHQSHFNPFTQFSYRWRMNSGCQSIFLPASINFFLISRYLINHCCELINSISVPQRSCAFVTWVCGSSFFIAPTFCQSSITFLRA